MDVILSVSMVEWRYTSYSGEFATDYAGLETKQRCFCS